MIMFMREFKVLANGETAMAAFCSARLASFHRESCRIVAAIDGYIRRACGHAFLTTTTGLSWHRIASQHTTQAAGSRVAV
jgi:hypothetical protein